MNKTLILVILYSLTQLIYSESMPQNFSGICYTVINNEGAGQSYWGKKSILKKTKGDFSQIFSVSTYLNGKKEGPDISYFNYLEGKIKTFTHYKDNQMHGRCLNFTTEGQILTDGYYKDGDMVNGTFIAFAASMEEGFISGLSIIVVTVKDGKEVNSVDVAEHEKSLEKK